MYLRQENPSLNKLKKRNKNPWLRILRYWWVRIARLQDNPPAIARGLACGVFAGSFPFFGFQMIIGILLAVLLRGNKIAAAAGTWISNPFTYVPIFAFNYQVGCILLGSDRADVERVPLETVSDIANIAKEKAVILCAGSTVVGLVLAVICYFITIKLITRWRKSRQFKRRSKWQQFSVKNDSLSKRSASQCGVLQGSSSDRD